MAAKILVVDDDVDICNGLAIYGQKLGFETLQAFSGDEALLLAERERPDIMLLDVMLPKVDGRDVMAQLKKMGLTDHTMVIFVSARDSQSDRLVGLDLGAVDYETKPIHFRSLFDKINRLLAKRARGEI